MAFELNFNLSSVKVTMDLSRSPRGVVPVSKNVVQMMQTRLEDVEDSANQLTKVGRLS